ncbi:MAG: fibronectin type III domain-containing protein [Gemmatimonadetes bacterium]|nr:fibronectin type III domain-containing protein [Gemmatimonadota bacterium]
MKSIVRAWSLVAFAALLLVGVMAPAAWAQAPSVPRNVTVLPASTELDTFWQSPATGAGVTNYLVSWRAAAAGAFTGHATVVACNGASTCDVVAAATSQPHTIDALTDGTAYDVVVRAVNSTGTGPASAKVTETPRQQSVTSVLDRLFDGSLNVFISAFNAMVASWAVVAPILVALAVGLYLWRRFTNRMA